MLIVKKFGGSSVADKEKIFACAENCARQYRQGARLVVVLSAMGDTTDDLIAMAKDINPDASAREMDMLLSTGEQISVALFSMALSAMRIPSVSLNAWQVPIHATRRYGNARMKRIETERIEHELGNARIVIVTGFQGINRYQDVVTLGRGGSDTTAVALAAALKADLCEINTDVDGVYTADPRIVPTARRLDRITYDEMLDMATLGAGVLHNRSVELAKKYNLKLVVRSSFADGPGTLIAGRNKKMERTLISGVALDRNIDRITLEGMKNETGSEFRLFHLLASKDVNVDLIIQSVPDPYTKDVSFSIKGDDLNKVLETLEENQEYLGYKTLTSHTNMCKLSIVGAGIMSNPGVAARMFEVLSNEGINIGMISTSEIRITALIKEEDAERAANAVHEAFIQDAANTGRR